MMLNKWKILALFISLGSEILCAEEFSSEELYSAESGEDECRSTQKEWWAWGDSTLQYQCNNQTRPLRFLSIHSEMSELLPKIRVHLKDTKKNICLARFCFVMRKGNKTFVKSFRNEDPLVNHIFISGADPNYFIGLTVDEKKKPDPCHVKYKTSGAGPNISQRKEFIDNFAVICPPPQHFLPLSSIIERLNERYFGVDSEALPVRARLAREWMNSNARYDSMKQWFQTATNSLPYHTRSNLIKPESEDLFFTNNEDSEQKLLYYLWYITDAVEGFNLLREIIKSILEDYWEKLFRLQFVYECHQLMVNKNSQDKETRKKCESLLEAAQNNPLQDNNTAIFTEKSIMKKFSNLCYYCMKQIPPSGKESYFLKELIALRNKVYAAFRNIVRLNKLLQDNEILQEKEYAKLGQDLEFLKSESLNNKFLQENQVIKSFTNLVEKCLLENQGAHISSVVLNIRSSNDACYACAPDLAREVHYQYGFAHFFSKYVSTKNPEKVIPNFRIIYSCANIREDIRCSRCSTKDLNPHKPNWDSYPSGILFHQHYLPEADTHQKKETSSAAPAHDDPDAGAT